MAYKDIDFSEDEDEDLNEEEEEEEMSASEKRIADYIIKKLAPKKKKKYPYPYPGEKKMDYEKKVSELKVDFEKKVSDLEKVNTELTEKLQEYEKVELDVKKTELFEVHKEKGLVKDEQKADFMKKYESFSGEQIDSLISTVKDFSAAKPEPTAFKGNEPGDSTKDFKKEMAELDSRINEFSEAGLKVEDLIQEKEALKKEMEGN